MFYFTSDRSSRGYGRVLYGSISISFYHKCRPYHRQSWALVQSISTELARVTDKLYNCEGRATFALYCDMVNSSSNIFMNENENENCKIIWRTRTE